jgi:hypothetical protein
LPHILPLGSAGVSVLIQIPARWPDALQLNCAAFGGYSERRPFPVLFS